MEVQSKQKNSRRFELFKVLQKFYGTMTQEQRLKLLASIDRSPELVLLDIINRIQTSFETTVESIRDDYSLKLKSVGDILSGFRDGKTPLRGVDYFTQEDIDYFTEMVKGFAPKDGKNGADGLPGQNGKDADETIIVQKVLAQLPRSLSIEEVASVAYNEVLLFMKDRKTPTDEDIRAIARSVQEKFTPEEQAEPMARAFEKLKGNDRLDYYALKNLPIIPSQSGRKKLGGSGASSGLSKLTLISGDMGQAVFVFSAAPTMIVVDQGRIITEGDGYSLAGSTATLDIWPTFSIIAFG